MKTAANGTHGCCDGPRAALGHRLVALRARVRLAAPAASKQHANNVAPLPSGDMPLTVVLPNGFCFTTNALIKKGSVVAGASTSAMPAQLAFNELLGQMDSSVENEWPAGPASPSLSTEGEAAAAGGIPWHAARPPLALVAAPLPDALPKSQPAGGSVAERRRSGSAGSPSAAAWRRERVRQSTVKRHQQKQPLPLVRRLQQTPNAEALLGLLLEQQEHAHDLSVDELEAALQQVCQLHRQLPMQALPHGAVSTAATAAPAASSACRQQLCMCLRALQPALRQHVQRLPGAALAHAARAAAVLRWHGRELWKLLELEAAGRGQALSVGELVCIALAVRAAGFGRRVPQLLREHLCEGGHAAHPAHASSAAGGALDAASLAELAQLVAEGEPARSQVLADTLLVGLAAVGGAAACTPAQACALLGVLEALAEQPPGEQLQDQLLHSVQAALDGGAEACSQLGAVQVGAALAAAAAWHTPGREALAASALRALEQLVPAWWGVEGSVGRAEQEQQQLNALWPAQTVQRLLRSLCACRAVPPCRLRGWLLHQLGAQLLGYSPPEVVAAVTWAQRLGGTPDHMLLPLLQRHAGMDAHTVMQPAYAPRLVRLLTAIGLCLDGPFARRWCPTGYAPAAEPPHAADAAACVEARRQARELVARLSAAVQQQQQQQQPLGQGGLQGQPMLQQLPVEALIALLWAGACTGHVDAPLAAAAAARLSGAQLERLHSKRLVQLVWGLAGHTAGASTPVVGYETLEQLCDALLPRLRSHNADGLSPQDAAAAAWAFAQLRHPNTQLFKALAELLEPRLRDLVAGDTIAVAVAMIQAGWASTALLRGLSRRLWWLMPTLGAAEVAQVMWAFGVAGYSDQSLIEATVARVEQLQGSLTNAGQLECIVFGLRQLGCAHLPLTCSLAAQLERVRGQHPHGSGAVPSSLEGGVPPAVLPSSPQPQAAQRTWRSVRANRPLRLSKRAPTPAAPQQRSW